MAIMLIGSPFISLGLQRFPTLRRMGGCAGLAIMFSGLLIASSTDSSTVLLWTQGVMYGFGALLVYFPAMFLIDEAMARHWVGIWVIAFHPELGNEPGIAGESPKELEDVVDYYSRRSSSTRKKLGTASQVVAIEVTGGGQHAILQYCYEPDDRDYHCKLRTDAKPVAVLRASHRRSSQVTSATGRTEPAYIG
ncbi:hypothetical protein CLCR_06247 [Cladophialophora carrionii]|uniref:Uncharacterized protein n=1 Tax=Cladophialophora carrionii TaxID=86049 RepID=A0A1C1C9M7_9EURO|nr:hypothetical protein CLCR_06247 [Cladophialophora carrionii]